MNRYLAIACAVIISISGHAQNPNVRLPEKPETRNFRNYSAEDSGFWMAIEAKGGSTVLFNRRNAIVSDATFTGGYRLNEFLKLGLGFGTKHFFKNDELRSSDIEWAFPVFADARGNFISQEHRNAVPYWSVDLGAEVRGGLYFSPTIGYRFGLPRSSFLLGVSYELMSTDTWKKDKEGISALMLKLGYEF